MGNLVTRLHAVAAIKVNPECDSIYEPGKKSVVSEPILKWQYLDFEDFFDVLVLHSKTPVHFTDYLLLKDLHFKDLEPGVTEVKAILNGALLKLIKDPRSHGENGEEDVLAVWAKVQVDREKKLIKNQTLDPDGSTNCWQYAIFHYNEQEESFRLESWVEMADGERRAGQRWCSYVEWVYLKPHLAARHISPKISLRSLQPAPHDPDLRILISSDMGHSFADAEELFNSLIALFKQETVELNGTVDYGDDENEVVLDADFALSPELKFPTRRHLTLHPESCALENEVSVKLPDRELLKLFTHYWRVYSDPVRVGFWVRRPQGTTACGLTLDQGEIGYRLFKLMEEKDVIKEVESLDEKNFFL